MSRKPVRCTLFGGVVVALAVAASPIAYAAESHDEAADAAKIVVAQAPTSSSPRASNDAAAPVAFPAYQRGVRQAAAEGPEALRRYTWRTRMIYNFYYHDFAPKE